MAICKILASLGRAVSIRLKKSNTDSAAAQQPTANTLSDRNISRPEQEATIASISDQIPLETVNESQSINAEQQKSAMSFISNTSRPRVLLHQLPSELLDRIFWFSGNHSLFLVSKSIYQAVHLYHTKSAFQTIVLGCQMLQKGLLAVRIVGIYFSEQPLPDFVPIIRLLRSPFLSPDLVLKLIRGVLGRGKHWDHNTPSSVQYTEFAILLQGLSYAHFVIEGKKLPFPSELLKGPLFREQLRLLAALRAHTLLKPSARDIPSMLLVNHIYLAPAFGYKNDEALFQQHLSEGKIPLGTFSPSDYSEILCMFYNLATAGPFKAAFVSLLTEQSHTGLDSNWAHIDSNPCAAQLWAMITQSVKVQALDEVHHLVAQTGSTEEEQERGKMIEQLRHWFRVQLLIKSGETTHWCDECRE